MLWDKAIMDTDLRNLKSEDCKGDILGNERFDGEFHVVLFNYK